MTQTFPIIYKRTATGAIQQWQQEINPDDPTQFRTISGQVGGQLVESAWRTCTGTNIGRSNERTPEEQVLFEIKANYTKKTDREYNYDIEDIDTAKVFLPMLAQPYDKHLKKFLCESSQAFTEPTFSQPKSDGMRCVATKDGMFSRNGKPIVSAPHIFESLKDLFEEYPTLVLDGELYNHELSDNFDELMSIFKKTKPKEKDLKKSAELGRYYLFDITTTEDIARENFVLKTDSMFSERLEILKAVSGVLNMHHSNTFELVPTDRVFGLEDLNALYTAYMNVNYEGQIVRLDAVYHNTRTDKLLKRKEWVDSEFELIRFEEGKGNWKGYAKKAWFKHDEFPDVEFKAGIRGSQAYTKKLLEDKEKYIGTMCTVIYAPQRTPAGIPRFGRVKEFNRTDIDV